MQKPNAGGSTALSRRRVIPKIKLFKKRKERKKTTKNVVREKERLPFESPQRHKMPSEIHISPGTPGSPYSAVSGATGLDAPPLKGKSMLQSVLPPLTSDADNASLQSYNLQMGRVNKTLFGENSSETAGGLTRTTVATSTIITTPASPEEGELRMVQGKKTFLSKSKWFQDVVKWAFETVDTDGSGKIGKKELYCGVLLIHLKLATYVGPAACRPATREYVHQIFDLTDIDNSGFLDKQEFGTVVTLLCSQILSRVFLQLGMTLLIVPIVSQYLLDFCGDVAYALQIVFGGVDEVMAIFMSILNFLLPAGIKNCLAFVISKTVEIVPDDFWATLTLTMISCTLGILLIPWMLYKVDGYFTSLATRNRAYKSSVDKVQRM